MVIYRYREHVWVNPGMSGSRSYACEEQSSTKTQASRDLILQQRQIGGLMSLSAYQLLTADAKNMYYGDLHVGGDVPPPTSGSLSIVQRPKSAMATFQARKRLGDIVLNPMYKANWSWTGEPLILGVPNGTWAQNGRNLCISTEYGTQGSYCGNNHVPCAPFAPFPLLRGLKNGKYMDVLRMNRLYDVIPDGSITYMSKTHGDRLLTLLDANLAASLVIDTGLVTAALSEMNAKQHDLLTELGELPELIQTIYDCCKFAITKYLETKGKVKRIGRDPRNLGDYTTKVSELWLQYRYAMQPIVYSVEDILASLELGVRTYDTLRSGIEIPSVITIDEVEYDIPVIHRVFLKRKYDISNVTQFSQNESLNGFKTAWELVPLSLLVDWFINIGDLLGAAFGMSYGETDGCLYSWQVKDASLELSDGTHRINITGGFYRALPIDPVSHIGLSFDPLINLKRSLDAMALSWSIFRSKR